MPTPRQNSHQDQPSGSCELSIVDTQGNWVQMMNTLQSGGIAGTGGQRDSHGGIPCHSQCNGKPHDLLPGQGGKAENGHGKYHGAQRRQTHLAIGISCGMCMPRSLRFYVNYLFFGMEPYEAVKAPRMLALTEGGQFHHRRPDSSKCSEKPNGSGSKDESFQCLGLPYGLFPGLLYRSENRSVMHLGRSKKVWGG